MGYVFLPFSALPAAPSKEGKETMGKTEELRFPTRPYHTHGGAHVPHRKNTAYAESVVMPCPDQVILAMQQHLGAPCVPTVKAGDRVSIGDVVGDSDKYVSAPIHASISGTVSKIVDLLLPTGQRTQGVVIASDGEMRLSERIAPPKAENLSDLLAAVRASGLVGLGGAGFPAHVKLNIPPDKKVDTLLVNAAECEPYITADNREALENSWAVLSGVYALKDLLGLRRVIIAVEGNKPEAIETLKKIADNDQLDPKDEVRILTLKSNYPQGAEKILVQACTGRRVPKGKLPADVGCLVMNITSIAFLANYLKTGLPLVSKRLTVDGSAIKNPRNVIVPIGTPIEKVIEFCGGYLTTPKKLLMGGPMMGMALTDDSLPVLKQNNAILAFDEKDARFSEPSACIRCGRCVESCPMNLMPTLIERQVQIKNAEGLEALSVATCMECGSCAFNCPAGRQLVQSMRLGKAILKNAGGRK